MNQRLCKPTPFYDSLKIESVERLYKAKYLGPWSVKDKNGDWSLHPVEVFYQPELQDPSHSHYFGVYLGPEGHAYICNAASAFSENIDAVISDDGEIIFSGYRHDYRKSKDGTAFIDGGRDYIRTNRKTISLTMVNGELIVS
jgi:hypothetical protein